MPREPQNTCQSHLCSAHKCMRLRNYGLYFRFSSISLSVFKMFTAEKKESLKRKSQKKLVRQVFLVILNIKILVLFQIISNISYIQIQNMSSYISKTYIHSERGYFAVAFGHM